MSGLTPDTPVPTGVVVHAKSRVLELQYGDGKSYRVPFELLRVFSPSAEVRGHGPGQETLQTGKRDVSIVSIEGVGNYALQPTFSDGHSTGLYSWDLLYDIAIRQDELWREYFGKLEAAGVDRDAPMAAAGAAHGHGHGHCH
ncbi:gamma-butyrobetaine hydroxylase-like domain-containing protein [Paraburkholderia sp. GAS42]|uniref:gamma-butyrobetaine hydroxylase-like domain-containing protein n=1 Tax=Paraburkholderia sp. GAS42 TaxID=3035135 RepID=UPI003D1AD5DC